MVKLENIIPNFLIAKRLFEILKKVYLKITQL